MYLFLFATLPFQIQKLNNIFWWDDHIQQLLILLFCSHTIVLSVNLIDYHTNITNKVAKDSIPISLEVIRWSSFSILWHVPYCLLYFVFVSLKQNILSYFAIDDFFFCRVHKYIYHINQYEIITIFDHLIICPLYSISCT